MDSLATIAARLCGRNLTDISEPAFVHAEARANAKPCWRRAPRTKAALAAKALAIGKAVRVLEEAKIAYSQPLPGKLVVPGVEGGKMITFWPARERLRIGRRPTKRQQDIHAFEQALADQGHRIPGYVSRRTRCSKPPSISKEERLRARQEADLAEMEHAHVQLLASLRQMTDDLIAGRRIRRRDPRSARAKRLFRRARN